MLFIAPMGGLDGGELTVIEAGGNEETVTCERGTATGTAAG